MECQIISIQTKDFPCRSSHGSSVPSLLTPGPVFLRRCVRSNKNDDLVDEVELTDVNPTYAHIRYPDGHESTISLQNLTPASNNREIVLPVEATETNDIVLNEIYHIYAPMFIFCKRQCFCFL